jgi:hypothetical protein
MLIKTTAYCPCCMFRMLVYVHDEAQKIHSARDLSAMVDKMAADHDPACARYHAARVAEKSAVTA